MTDFTIKGAVEFVRALDHRGIALHLASGTDEEDLIREAATLGYADCFKGGVCGATGDIGSCSKRMVVAKILRESGCEEGDIVCVGDGPVEIREAKRRGGFTVGVASDEIRRFGLSRAKRNRLIRAGADMVIPDFSQWPRLVSYLLGQRTLATE